MLTNDFKAWVAEFVRIDPDYLGQPERVRLDYPKWSTGTIMTRDQAEYLADRIREAAGMILPFEERFRGEGMGIKAGDL